VAAVIGSHEDVGAALQFGTEAARRFELEPAGAGHGRALDAVARQEVAGAPGFVRDRLAALQVQKRRLQVRQPCGCGRTDNGSRFPSANVSWSSGEMPARLALRVCHTKRQRTRVSS